MALLVLKPLLAVANSCIALNLFIQQCWYCTYIDNNLQDHHWWLPCRCLCMAACCRSHKDCRNCPGFSVIPTHLMMVECIYCQSLISNSLLLLWRKFLVALPSPPPFSTQFTLFLHFQFLQFQYCYASHPMIHAFRISFSQSSYDWVGSKKHSHLHAPDNADLHYSPAHHTSQMAAWMNARQHQFSSASPASQMQPVSCPSALSTAGTSSSQISSSR